MKIIRTIEELDALPAGAVISKCQPDRFCAVCGANINSRRKSADYATYYGDPT